jgi:hypothetical protein
MRSPPFCGQAVSFTRGHRPSPERGGGSMAAARPNALRAPDSHAHHLHSHGQVELSMRVHRAERPGPVSAFARGRVGATRRWPCTGNVLGAPLPAHHLLHGASLGRLTLAVLRLREEVRVGPRGSGRCVRRPPPNPRSTGARTCTSPPFRRRAKGLAGGSRHASQVRCSLGRPSEAAARWPPPFRMPVDAICSCASPPFMLEAVLRSRRAK